MRPLLLTIGGKLAEVTLIYTIIVFSISYALSHLGFSRAQALNAVVIGSVFQIFSIPFFGWVGDKIGARRLYIAGTLLLAMMAIPLFHAIGSGSLASYTLAPRSDERRVGKECVRKCRSRWCTDD